LLTLFAVSGRNPGLPFSAGSRSKGPGNSIHCKGAKAAWLKINQKKPRHLREGGYALLAGNRCTWNCAFAVMKGVRSVIPALDFPGALRTLAVKYSACDFR
jgi:hypothetical protein